MPASKNGAVEQSGYVTRNQFNRMVRYLRNDASSLRELWLRAFQGGITRDIDTKCGYPPTLGINDYQTAYDRHDIASRIVRLYPNESWKIHPDVYETEDMQKNTEFEKAWASLIDEFQILAKLHEADKLSGIGRFGILLIGLNDGKTLDQPVDGFDNDGNREDGAPALQPIYFRAFSEAHVEITSLIAEPSSRRFGMPEFYDIKFADADSSKGAVNLNSVKPTKVHWTRVIHFCDNREGGEVYGIPRLQQVYNRIYDLRKVLGGNGEGFWKQGYPGISLETHPSIEDPEMNLEEIREEAEKFAEGNERVLVTSGMHANSLSANLADPSRPFEVHMTAIAVAMDVPLRILMGTEEGKLASGQDMRAWNSRLMGRQQLYINPYILRPFVNRMIAYGALPKPEKVLIDWADLNAPTDNDKATHAQKITESVVKYIAAGANQLVPPQYFFTVVLGWKQDLVEQMLKAAEEYSVDELPSASDILTPPEMEGDAKQEGVNEGSGQN